MGDKVPHAPANPMADLGAQESFHHYVSTQPIRSTVQEQAANVVDTGSVEGLPQGQVASESLGLADTMSRAAIENQFKQAGEAIRASAPGGMMQQSLANLEGARAGQVAGLTQQQALREAAVKQDIMNDILNKAYGMAAGAPQTSMAGVGSVANAQAQQNAARLAQYTSPLDWASFGSNPKGKSK